MAEAVSSDPRTTLMAQLVLLPQGGLGNQLIQFGYGQSLASRSGASVQVNPVLLGASWARLRGVSFRPLSPWLAGYWPEVQGRRFRCLDLLQSKLSRLQGRVLVEGSNDADLMDALAAAHGHRRFWMLGYYQRRQAFSADALPLWRHVATKLMPDSGFSPHPQGQVALHVRLGDYLLPQNQRLFAQLPVQDLVARALRWREQLRGRSPISLFTDSPALLTAQLEQHCSSGQRSVLKIQSHASATADFLAMLRYRHIVASNSTFSLCAGQLSWLLWGDSSGPSLLLPPRWYRDEHLDRQQRQELEACRFTTTTPA
jgi:hypothetical protein